MKAINIALRREDGKVETDTVYRENMFTEDEVREISGKYNCDVLVCYIGDFMPLPEDQLKANSIIYNREKKGNEDERNEDNVCQPAIAE
jgi:hypothetical protein